MKLLSFGRPLRDRGGAHQRSQAETKAMKPRPAETPKVVRLKWIQISNDWILVPSHQNSFWPKVSGLQKVFMLVNSSLSHLWPLSQTFCFFFRVGQNMGKFALSVICQSNSNHDRIQSGSPNQEQLRSTHPSQSPNPGCTSSQNIDAECDGHHDVLNHRSNCTSLGFRTKLF